MKINGQYPKPTAGDRNVQNAATEGSKAAKQSAPTAQQSEAKPVQTDLTLGRVRAKIEAEPDVDTAKVNAIKERLASGQYQVDAKLLAANLIKGSLLEDN